jgi:hypothetical protein
MKPVKRQAMITGIAWVVLLLALTARADVVQELGRIKTSDELARFIFSTSTNETALRSLLAGLDSTNSIQAGSYSSPIPVREICGTIISERFADVLGSGFYEQGKKHGVREICAFQDSGGTVWRYHIGIYDDRQYRLMRDLLRKKLRIPPSTN